ncbi:MAG: MerC domain-containing protein [Bacteroidota bacterium]
MRKYFYDYLGIISSGICLIHCLATPILFFVQRYFQKKLQSDAYENQYWDYVFLLVSFIAVFSTTQHLKSRRIIVVFWAFFTLFAVAILFEDDFKYLNFLGYTSSIGLIITHLLNIKHCKKCQSAA